MKIYLLLDQTTHTSSITCCFQTAANARELFLSRGHKVFLYEGELKTHGSNFGSWASNWKLFEI